MFPKSKGLLLPNVAEDLLLPPYEGSRDYMKPVVVRTSDNLALPSKIYPYIIHSYGNHDYAFNNPCPNEKDINKK